MKRGLIKELLRSDKTVYSFKELALLWPDIDAISLKARVNYYVKTGDLYHLRRGLYAKDKNYDRLELATKILIPSYVSFETVLLKAGITFQYYKAIFVASYYSRQIICDGQEYVFRRIKAEILTNSKGIELGENYSIAIPERAFLDLLYLNKNYYFDNLGPLNWDTIYEILPIYQNKRMEKEVKKYHAAFKKGLL